MAGEMVRLALVIAGGLFSNDNPHADAIVCLDQARQMIADAKEEPGRPVFAPSARHCQQRACPAKH
jgi:hypothetical protein